MALSKYEILVREVQEKVKANPVTIFMRFLPARVSGLERIGRRED